jgi:NADH-quinone oxidoreductase subunit G
MIAEAPAADFGGLTETRMSREPFVSPIADFYQTNPIARASNTMAQASALLQTPVRQAAE